MQSSGASGSNQSNQSNQFEFVTLMALLMSLVALAIDAILPALNIIGRTYKVTAENDVQLIISFVFLGMGLGLFVFGPFSDSFGRKPTIYIGVSVFIVGCGVSYIANSMPVMLLGRGLQGFGAASTRVITAAMIRDKFVGDAMAKIMSMIMMVFVMVPALAPALGQLIMELFHWRDIFSFMGILASLGLIWFLRLPETLPENKRLDFSFQTIWGGLLETARHPISRGYTIASGLMFGAFIGYLSSSQQILQIQYGLGEQFPLYFGSLAIVIGSASFVNSRLVEKLGMVMLCRRALFVLSVSAALFIGVAYMYDGHPPLMMLMPYLGVTFFCFGILFGNFNALAMEPMGHIAGVANSVISASQTIISVGFGGFVGYMYNGTVMPLVIGFLVLGLLSFMVMFYTSHKAALRPA